MTKAFKKHLLRTLAMAVLLGLISWIANGWEKGLFWFAIAIAVNMLTWLGFKETFERETPDD